MSPYFESLLSRKYFLLMYIQLLL